MRCKEIEDLFVDRFLEKRSVNIRDNSMTRISSSGDPMCKIFLRRTGAPTVPHTAHQIYTFETGHMYHEYWQKAAHEVGLSWAEPYTDKEGNACFRGLAEVCVKDEETGAMGHFDLMTAPIKRDNDTRKLLIGEGESHYIVDFKTMTNIPRVYAESHDRTWPKRVRPGMNHLCDNVSVNLGDFDNIEEIKEEHRMQASAYAFVINEYGLPQNRWPATWSLDGVRVEKDRVYPKVGGILLIYLAKDKGPMDYEDPYDVRNCPIKAFVERVDDTVVEGLRQKYREANWFVENGVMPPKVDWQGGMAFPCAYCEFRNTCWPDSFTEDGRPKKKR